MTSRRWIIRRWLVGIVVNNAIVLVDRVNQLRRGDGMIKMEALILGTQERLRPILMTTLTTVLGLLPMALGFGEAAELRTPMAVSVTSALCARHWDRMPGDR
ncbi:MAG: efflux RND transporter permease subunit [Candidatus Azotimanducaceae bacterium]|tara:strand:+ start:184 stop:489 length:306 start_codon:yes stop_codon:yes gene_type:complete